MGIWPMGMAGHTEIHGTADPAHRLIIEWTADPGRPLVSNHD